MSHRLRLRGGLRSTALVAVGLLAVFAIATAEARSTRFTAWGAISDPRFGFQIAYPVDVLLPVDSPAGFEGRMLQSGDGRAKLLVATFANDQGLTLAQYRQFLLDGNYAGTAIDYAPVRRRWFVLSGERGDATFYERVTFSCGGRLINSWAMIYPTAEKRFYDRVVEAVARTYVAGAGPGGTCRLPDLPDAPAEAGDDDTREADPRLERREREAE
jgi:hypothetical protein